MTIEIYFFFSATVSWAGCGTVMKKGEGTTLVAGVRRISVAPNSTTQSAELGASDR
jgi:hypothetical protein